MIKVIITRRADTELNISHLFMTISQVSRDPGSRNCLIIKSGTNDLGKHSAILVWPTGLPDTTSLSPALNRPIQPHENLNSAF